MDAHPPGALAAPTPPAAGLGPVTARPWPDGPRFDRRRLLLTGASALVLAACGQARPTATPAAGSASVAAATTVTEFMAKRQFFVAHRGSYDNWAEHTQDAYSHAVAAGAQALEISVNATSDGVLVCHHDQTTGRLSAENVTIAETSYADLSQIMIDARPWLGPAAALQPMPRLTDVLDQFAASHVLFIEDKQGTNTTALLDLMDRYPDPHEHFVWKQWAGAGQFQAAADRGYRRWGYFTADALDRLDELQGRFDYLGIPTESTDAEIAAFVATGKPVMAWEVHTRSERDRLLALGARGLMCSNVPYVAAETDAAIATADSFASGLRAAGDLPWTTSKGSSYQPVLDAAARSITIQRPDIESYCLGSMCPVARDTYTLTFDLRWPGALPAAHQHAGLAFGQDDDRPYRVRVASAVAGYHVILRPSGSLELFSRAAGQVSGTQLGVVATSPASAGEWITITVAVSPDGIRLARSGQDDWAIEVADTTYRGGYLSLGKNYADAVPVEFRAVSIS